MKVAPGARIALERAWLRSVSELCKGGTLEAMRTRGFSEGSEEWFVSPFEAL